MNILLRVSAMSALLLAACAHDSSTASTLPAAPVMCDTMADHVMTVMSTKDAPADEVAKIRAVLVNQCKTTNWSEGAKRCLAGIKTINDGDQCEAMLTEAQRDALAKESEAMGSDPGAASGAAPPGGAAPAAMAPGAAPPPPAGAVQPAMNAPMASPSPSPPSAKKSKSSTRTGDPCAGGE